MKHFILIFLLPFSLTAQNKYGLTPMKMAEYSQSIKINPENELVNLAEFIPGIVLEIGYATTKNFTGKKIYTMARAYARKPVAEALKRIQADLKNQGLELKIFDGYFQF